MKEVDKSSNEILKNFVNSEIFKKQTNLYEERRKTIKKGDNVIHLSYVGVLEDEDLLEIENLLKSANLELSSFNKSGMITNSLEDYSFVTNLVIEQAIVIELIKGLGTNAVWDVIKAVVVFTKSKITGKKIFKVRKGSTEEKDATLNMDVKVDENASFKFEIKGSEEVVEKSLDKVLDFIREQKSKSSYQNSDYLKFSEDEDKWIKVDLVKGEK